MPDGSETSLAAVDERLAAIPLMQFFPGRPCNGDPTELLGAQRPCVEAMLGETEFRVRCAWPACRARAVFSAPLVFESVDRLLPRRLRRLLNVVTTRPSPRGAGPARRGQASLSQCSPACCSRRSPAIRWKAPVRVTDPQALLRARCARPLPPSGYRVRWEPPTRCPPR
jgi:hypothetical protein